MNAAPTVAAAPTAEPHGVPQLRTILLTDLVDSTALVERLGDGAAAELFRAHDRLVLRLQNHWRGRLIDRSDGLLLLFERPVDGLGFALDYFRGLRELGAPHGADIKARAGLHVGEVLSWRNSDEAVRVGAKPVEVEGLAKPMAARLMSMARPGQLLMSAVAEPLAHRAARELGERGQNLLWKSHGRWRFKGVPEPQQIFEVGEPGITPLRAPPGGPKAWRDIPLWRRPAALAAELALVAVIGVGIWFVTKPQPAIAFNQRDWVVVADLRNLTDQPLLDDSLEQAFRISLEQSRHVNVLSDLKTRQTLERMRLPPGTELDRAIASEIAIRDGARAVILPTVAEIGGRVRVSAEVIDPNSQTTVYSEYADGKGAVSALASIDEVTAALREKLGEALEAVEQDSKPLPEVTTENLDALRSYALGVNAYARLENAKALKYYKRALEIDPDFAIAHLAIARTYIAESDASAAQVHMRAAENLQERLIPRDKLYLDAWLASDGPVNESLDKWKMLADLYPDYFAGHYNFAWKAAYLANRYQDGLVGATAAASSQNPLQAAGYYLRGVLNTALGNFRDAARDFSSANNLGKSVGRAQIGFYLATRQFDKASAAMEQVKPDGTDSGNLERHLGKITFAIDKGEWLSASAAVDAAVIAGNEVGPFYGRVYRAIELSYHSSLNPEERFVADLQKFVSIERDAMLRVDDPERRHAVFALLMAGYLAERNGVTAVSEKLLTSVLPVLESLDQPVLTNMHAVVRAEQLRNAGQPEAAIELLDEAIDGRELYQAHVARMEAYADAGRLTDAIREADWLATHRGRAYAEYGSHFVLMALNVADSNLALLRAAELHHALGQDDQADQALQRFDAVWLASKLPRGIAARREAILAAQ